MRLTGWRRSRNAICLNAERWKRTMPQAVKLVACRPWRSVQFTGCLTGANRRSDARCR